MNVEDIVTEFGAYYINQGQNADRLVTMLYNKSETETYFQTVVTDDEIWRASKVTIDRLLQPFQKAWTPIGTAKFEPKEIRQYRMKIDFEDWPDDLQSTWLGFLMDNGLDRTQWPIVRYLIEKLIMPKSEEDFELNEAYKGIRVAPTPGTAGAASTSIVGVRKWITDAIADSVAPITMGTVAGLTDAEFVDYVEDFCKQIDDLYRDNALTPLFMNKDLALKYYYGYGDKYGLRQDFTGNNMTVKGTNITAKGLKSMSGSNRLWITPTGNAKRLVKQTVSKGFKIEGLKRQIFLYTDFWKGLGFVLPELLFFSDQA